MNIPNHISESLKIFNPGSGMEKIRIQNKYPGSATPRHRLETSLLDIKNKFSQYVLQSNFQTDCFRIVVVYLSVSECTYGRGCGSGLALILDADTDSESH
jgi:hypothetical protein